MLVRSRDGALALLIIGGHSLVISPIRAQNTGGSVPPVIERLVDGGFEDRVIFGTERPGLMHTPSAFFRMPTN